MGQGVGGWGQGVGRLVQGVGVGRSGMGWVDEAGWVRRRQQGGVGWGGGGSGRYGTGRDSLRCTCPYRSATPPPRTRRRRSLTPAPPSTPTPRQTPQLALIGGDSGLSANGEAYASALPSVLKSRVPRVGPGGARAVRGFGLVSGGSACSLSAPNPAPQTSTPQTPKAPNPKLKPRKPQNPPNRQRTTTTPPCRCACGPPRCSAPSAPRGTCPSPRCGGAGRGAFGGRGRLGRRLLRGRPPPPKQRQTRRAIGGRWAAPSNQQPNEGVTAAQIQFITQSTQNKENQTSPQTPQPQTPIPNNNDSYPPGPVAGPGRNRCRNLRRPNLRPDR
jgi:hypothetical protein